MPSPDPNRTAPHAPPTESTADHTPGTAGETPPSSDAGRSTPRGERAAGEAAFASEPAPPGVPGFEILGELGRGGMGVVYKARHVTLNRLVALKMVLCERTGRGELVRFLAEAEAVAAVRHPNVVQVYECGEHDGRPFLALEYLAGGTLAGALRRSADLRERVSLVARVARGVAAAHALGIVHRDLKPGNVLLDAAGEPKVTDFGLAKRASSDLTATQAVMGTPAYMSPEQAKGDTKFVGPQADVWALGVVLYEALTGGRPFAGTVRETLAKIQAADPAPPRKLAPAVPRDLELICLKCLEKLPHERYPTAKELADDLDRLARGEPISVRPAGRLERTYKWARRKPFQAAVVALTGLAVVLAGAAAGAAVLWWDARSARTRAEGAEAEAVTRRGEAETDRGRAERAEAEAVRAKEEAVAVRYARDVHTAHQEFRENNPVRARAILDTCPVRHRGWEWRYIHRLCHQELVALAGHTGHVDVAAFSGDGKRVLTTGTDGTARLWDASTGKELLVIPVPNLLGAALSPDGRHVLASGSGGSSAVWDSETGKPVATLRDGGGAGTLVFARDGARVLTFDAGGVARVWDTRTWGRLCTLSGREVGSVAVLSPDGRRVATGFLGTRVWDAATGKSIASMPAGGGRLVTFSPDSRYLLTAGPGPLARVWDAGTGTVVSALSGHTNDVHSGSFSPDGTRVATAGEDNTARVWDPATGQEVCRLEGHAKGVLAAAFSPDGARVVTAGKDHTARLYDAKTGECLAVFFGHTGYYVTTAAFSPDGTRVVTSGGTDGTARVWDATSDAEAVKLPGVWTESAGSAQWSPDGRRVAGSDQDGPGIWDAETGKRVVALATEKGHYWHVEFSRDGTRVVGFGGPARGDQFACVWDAATGRESARFVGHAGSLRQGSLGADGSRLLTVGADRTARTWDAKTGEPLAVFSAHTAVIWAAALSPDGRTVVTAADDKTVRVWDADTGKERFALAGHGGAVPWAAFTPDGSRILTSGGDRTIRVWDAATGKELRRLNGLKNGGVLSAAFSPDGSRLVATDFDLAARVWDLATGAELRLLVGHSGGVGAVRYHPDGTRIVTQSHDRTARVWDADSGELLLTLPSPGDNGAVAFSPDGRRLLVTAPRLTSVYDSAPLNHEFVGRDPARP